MWQLSNVSAQNSFVEGDKLAHTCALNDQLLQLEKFWFVFVTSADSMPLKCHIRRHYESECNPIDPSEPSQQHITHNGHVTPHKTVS